MVVITSIKARLSESGKAKKRINLSSAQCITNYVINEDKREVVELYAAQSNMSQEKDRRTMVLPWLVSMNMLPALLLLLELKLLLLLL